MKGNTHMLQPRFFVAASFLVSSMLMVGVGNSLAISQTDIAWSSTGVASFDSIGPVLGGGSDTLTFANLAPATYDFTLTMSGQYLTITTALLNGISGTIIDTGKWTFLGIDGTSDVQPFTLQLIGKADAPNAVYSGELTASARSVPEPGTLLLLLLGVGLIGIAARERQNV
jgi:hypothetical protein